MLSRRRNALTSSVLATVLLCPVVAHAQLAGDSARAFQVPPDVSRDAAGRVRIARGLSLRAPGATDGARVAAFLRAHGAAFDLDDLELAVDDVRVLPGYRVVVLRRYVRGERVHRRSVLLRFDDSGTVDLVYASAGARAVDDRPRTVGDARVARLAETLVPFAGGRAHVTRRFVDVGGRLVRGFVVEVDGPRPTQRAELVFDRDGRLLAAGPRTVHALGRVFPANPVVDMEMTSDVDLPNLTSTTRLTGRYVRVASCPVTGECDPVQAATADMDGDFLYEPSDPAYDDEFSEVSAYYHSDRIAAYFRDVHEFIWDCCETSTVLNVVANYTEAPSRPYNNAAYSPSACSRSQCGTIVLGQGPLRDYSYDGDVVYHEYTHAVVDTLANIAGFDFDDLGISYEPSALNEGMADYFSATLAGDATVAEYFAGSGALGTSGALRDLENDLRCPDDLFGEGHRDGRIYGATGWSLRNTLGADKADALIYGTLTVMVDNTDFDEAAGLLMATAEAFEAEGTFTAADVTAVADEIAARGLSGCRRILPLDDGEEHLGYSGTGFATGTLGGSVAPTHYSIAIPADATGLTIDVVPATMAGEHTLFLRDGESLRFVGSDLRFDTEIPVDTESRSVELGAGDPHPLPRCQTLYLALRTEDLGTAGESVYSLRATLETSGDPDAECPELPVDAGVDAAVDAAGDGGDAGPDGGDGAAAGDFVLGGGGCRCDASGAAPRPDLFVPAVLLALLARRRR